MVRTKGQRNEVVHHLMHGRVLIMLVLMAIVALLASELLFGRSSGRERPRVLCMMSPTSRQPYPQTRPALRRYSGAAHVPIVKATILSSAERELVAELDRAPEKGPTDFCRSNCLARHPRADWSPPRGLVFRDRCVHPCLNGVATISCSSPRTTASSAKSAFKVICFSRVVGLEKGGDGCR